VRPFSRSRPERVRLRNARLWTDGALQDGDVLLVGQRVAEVGPRGSVAGGEREADLEGRILLPGLVNAHDHLDFSTFPFLGTPPYRSLYEWASAVDAGRGDPRVKEALSVLPPDRLFLGGLRNLLAGVTAVAHHNPYHRSLGQRGFPVRVLARYQFAHSPGLTPNLRRTYRSTDRRIPWMIHAGEGVDERCRTELAQLREARLLRENTVIIHAVALGPGDGPVLAAQGAAVVWCPESNRRLYGATAPVRELRAAGVRLGLGSDSPVSGVRDPLSNLAWAAKEDVLAPTDLIRLATTDSAAVARLPLGGAAVGAAADLLAVDALEPLLAGDRRAIALVVGAGQALWGRDDLMRRLVPDATPFTLEGEPRAMSPELARRTARLWRAHSSVRGMAWAAGLTFGAPARSDRP
jgi:cytosine/adenosine deaminase-related metal-dependent hydrolase